MKTRDILDIVLCGVLIVAGGYLIIKLIKWIGGMLLVGTAGIMTFLYAFAPIIIIILLVLILLKLRNR